MSGSGLRGELSRRNSARAAEWAAESSFSTVPSIIYGENDAGEHGNFLRASYQRILSQADWHARMGKVYTGSRFIPGGVIAHGTSWNAPIAQMPC